MTVEEQVNARLAMIAEKENEAEEAREKRSHYDKVQRLATKKIEELKQEIIEVYRKSVPQAASEKKK
jgi:hypothetical protein